MWRPSVQAEGPTVNTIDWLLAKVHSTGDAKVQAAQADYSVDRYIPQDCGPFHANELY